MSRGGSKIGTYSHDYAAGERVDWLDQLADNIQKASQRTAVDVARYRNELSVHEQMTSIVSRKPAHATVESLVEEYHERTGLAEYLKRAAEKQEKPDKVAFSMTDHAEAFDDFGPDVRDKIVSFCKNKIDTSHGQTSVPAIQCEIISAFNGDGVQPKDVENEKVARLISALITESQMQSPPTDRSAVDLGKGVGVVDVEDADEDNTDFYKGLMPYMGQGS